MTLPAPTPSLRVVLSTSLHNLLCTTTILDLLNHTAQQLPHLYDTAYPI